MWEREDHVKISYWEEVFGTFREPLLTSVGLTFWAVPISTRVIGDDLVAVRRASVQMATESLRTAVPDGPQHFQLRPRQMAFIPANEAIASRPDDVGHLERWPIHLLTLFRERFTWSGLERSTASRGLLTACR
jgi:hypothetical protein